MQKNKQINKKTASPGSTTFRFPIRPTKVWNFCPGSNLLNMIRFDSYTIQCEQSLFL